MAETKQQNINWIKQNGIQTAAKQHLIKHLEGGKLTRKEAMLAKCYDCCNGYADGRIDCEVPNCPLYQFMPYRKKSK